MRRSPCFSDAELAAWTQGKLAATAAAELVEHLQTCDNCQAKVRQHDSQNTSLAPPRQARTIEQPTCDLLPPAGEAVANTLATPTPAIPLAQPVPQQIGNYEILRELGRGGMGVVYLARQTSLNRLVALKRILVGTPASLSRFCTEAETTARLRHPNLVQIYEIGWHEELPYLSMEYVEGSNLQVRLADTPQPPEWAAAMLETLAQAIDVAHQHQIIHRDLKPANVLLTREEQPKITDFGLAKQLDSDLRLTESGTVLGTPTYMAPEQARGDLHMGPATDIYSLGVILYEMLTGRVPFEGPNTFETLLMVVNNEPVPPRQLQPKVPGDLETICLKCLAKEPHKRYHSAAALAEDLRRFRNRQPILARPTPLWERAWKWTRREPLVAALLAAVVLVTVLGFTGIVWKWRDEIEQKNRAIHASNQARSAQRAEAKQRHAAEAARDEAKRERDRALTARDQAELSAYFSRIAQARLEWRLNHDVEAAASLLDRCRPRPGQTDRRGWEWYYLWNLLHSDLFTLRGHSSNVVGQLVFSPDGRLLASAGGGNPFYVTQGPGMIMPAEIIIWDAATGQPLRRLSGHTNLVRGVAFSPDGQQLASVSHDYTLRLWNVATGRELQRFRHRDQLHAVAFSPDGQYIALGHHQTVTLWDPTTGRVLRTLTGLCQTVISLAISPDGRFLAAGTLSQDGTRQTDLIVWDTTTWQPRFTERHWLRQVDGLAFSPDSRLLAAAGSTVRLWEIASGRLLQTMTPPTGDFLDVAFGPDGERLATLGSDHTVRLWNVQTEKEETIFRGHRGLVGKLTFHPSGRYLASGSGGEIKIWDLTRPPEFALVPPTWKPVEVLGFRADSPYLLTVTQDGLGRVIDVATGTVLARPQVAMSREWLTPAQFGAFDGAGRRLAAISEQDPRLIHVWDVEQTGAATRFVHRHTLGEKAADRHHLHVYQVVLSRDGRRVATAAMRGLIRGQHCREIKVWDAVTGQLLLDRVQPIVDHKRFYGGLALSPDGALVAFDDQTQIVICAAAAGAGNDQQPRLRLHLPTASLMTTMAFSPDGRCLAAATLERTGSQVRLWNVATGQPLHRDKALPGAFYQLAFSPDNRRLAGVNREELKLWDVATGEEIVILRGAPPRPSDNGYNPLVAWSPDGTRLAVCNWDNSISIWDITDQTAEAARLVRRQQAEVRAFSWHVQQAAYHQRQQHSWAFAFHWQQLHKATPGDAPSLRGRGLLHAQQGQWREAAADYAQALEKQPAEPVQVWLEAAALQLLADDLQTYQRLRQTAAQIRTSSSDTAQVLVRLLTLGRDRSPPPTELAHLIQQLQTLRPLDPWLVAHALARAYYRSGQYEAAIEWCQRSLEDQQRWDRHPLNWLVLALAHHQLERPAEARKWLKQTEDWLNTQTKGRPEQPQQLLDDAIPSDTLELLVLHREAKALIDKDKR